MTLAVGQYVESSAPTVAVKKTILSVQVMRGLAAAAVAVYHTHLILAQPEYGGISVLETVASRGWLGVNFFFVLSGFIIIFAHAKDVGKPRQIVNYLWKRFARVYPIYWIFLTLFLIAAYCGIGHPSFSWNGANIASAYALVKLAEPLSLPLQVAWTLFYEVTFYAIFVTLLANRVLGIVVLSAWTISIFVSSFVFGNEPGTLHMWGDMWCAYFMIGMCVYFLFRTLDGQRAIPILVSGLAILVIMGWQLASGKVSTTQKDPAILLALAIPFALILLGCALGEQHRQWKPPGFLLRLGDATYAIYLVHSPAITVVALLNHRFAMGILPPLMLFALTVVASISAGMLAHIYVERPVLRALRGIFPS